jgi:hypothetical protein
MYAEKSEKLIEDQIRSVENKLRLLNLQGKYGTPDYLVYQQMLKSLIGKKQINHGTDTI